jgi:hypothetical protein
MLTLVYKMTHTGDPDPGLGCWGGSEGCDCMGQDRDWPYEAVIGFGGRSWWKSDPPSRAGEIVWIGIRPHKTEVEGKKDPEVTFEHFLYLPRGDLMLCEIAPDLAARVYDCRAMMYGFSEAEEQDIERILDLARDAPPSSLLTVQAAR